MKENKKCNLRALLMKRHRSADPYAQVPRPGTSLSECHHRENISHYDFEMPMLLGPDDMVSSSSGDNQIKINSKMINIGENPFHIMNNISNDESPLIINNSNDNKYSFNNDYYNINDDDNDDKMTQMKIGDEKSSIMTNSVFEIDDYETPIKMKDNIDLIKKENEILNFEYKNLKDNLENAYLQIDELNLNVKNLQKKINLIDGDLVEAREKGIHYLNELNECQENLKKAKNEIKEYDQKNELLSTEINLKEKEILNLKEINKKEKCDTEALKEEVLRLKDENFQNNKELNKIEDIKSEEIKLISIIEILKNENERLKEEEIRMKSEMSKYMDNTKIDNETLETLKKELIKEKNENKAYCSKLENEYEIIKREYFKLKQELIYYQEKLQMKENSVIKKEIIPNNKRFKKEHQMHKSHDLNDILIDLNNRKNHLEAEYVKLPSRSGRSQQERNRKYVIENELDTILNEMGSIRLKLKKNTESRTSINLIN